MTNSRPRRGITKILIANRGEIAVRILHTLKKMGITSVVVYAADDVNELILELADESYLLKGDKLSDTYLNIDAIINIAQLSGADAIHPGYGFLAESHEFATKCKDAGILFIGPKPEHIRLMGNKTEAIKLVRELGLPVLKNLHGNLSEIIGQVTSFSFPVIVKAAAGGGGKGMKVVENANQFAEIVESASREAMNYFGNGEVYVEEFIPGGKHIEVQVLGDGKGNALHLYDRECSVQRRYQKIVEEAPAPSLTKGQRNSVIEYALKIVNAVKYQNAGTIEFLMDSSGNLYFLEMNTRVQVEHTVTEMITGIDIVSEQIIIARDQEFSIDQKDIKTNGHAVEARVYAEDPANDFSPSPGKIVYYNFPKDKSLRVDSAMFQNFSVSPNYDPLIAKLVVSADNRETAIEKLICMLGNSCVLGIRTNLSFLTGLIKSDEFLHNTIVTDSFSKNKYFVENILKNNKQKLPLHVLVISYLIARMNHEIKKPGSLDPWETIGYFRNQLFFEVMMDNFYHVVYLKHNVGNLVIEVDGTDYNVKTHYSSPNNIGFELNGKKYDFVYEFDEKQTLYGQVDGWGYEIGLAFNSKAKDWVQESGALTNVVYSNGANTIRSPFHGKVIKINVEESQTVKKGELLIIIEAMKIENNIIAPRDAVVKKVSTSAGNQVDKDEPLIILN